MRHRSLPLIMLVCWLSLLWPAAAEPVPLDLVYTGNEGGVTGYSLLMEEANLFAGQPEWELTNLTLDLPAYRQGLYLLMDPDGLLSTSRVRAFFQHGPIRIEAGTPTVMADSNYSMLIQWPPQPTSWVLQALFRLNTPLPRFPDLAEKAATVSPVVNGRGERLWLIRNDGRPRFALADLLLPGAVAASASDAGRRPRIAAKAKVGPAPLPGQPGFRFGMPDFSAPERWEPVFGSQAVFRHQGQDARLFMVGRQHGTWDRRLAMLRRALAMRSGALLVGTGNTIDKPRMVTGGEARHLSWEAIKTLPYTAFLPSAAEFSLSLDDLRQFSHDLPLVAANVTPPDPEVELPPYRIVEVGGIRVGIVGIVDREGLRDAGVARIDAGWQVHEPVKAARQAVKTLHDQGVGIVVVVTDLAAAGLRTLEESLEGVDLIVGGAQRTASDLSLQQEVRFDQASVARHSITPLVVSPRVFRFGAVRMTVDGDRAHAYPISYQHQQWRISDDEPGDPAFAWQVAALRDAAQGDKSYALLPDVRSLTGTGTPIASQGNQWARYSDSQWTRMAASLVRESLGAEIVLLPRLPLFRRVAGPIPGYVVEGWLSGQDRLIPLDLTGAQLMQLKTLDEGFASLVIAGYDPGIGKICGLPLASGERYRVIASDRVLTNARFGAVFGKADLATRSLGDLRPLVMGKLEGLRRTVPGYPEALSGTFSRWVNDDGTRIEPHWAVNFEELGVNALSFQNVNQEPYSKVRNTRINTPQNSTLGTQGRVSLAFTSEAISWTSRVKAAYQQLRLAEHIQENADDLVLTTEMRFNLWRIPLQNSAIPITPYLFGSYDTEFTPGVDPKTKVENPQQRDFDGIAGLVVAPGNGFQEIKLGTIARYDLAASVFRPGLQLATTFEKQLTTVSPIKLRLGADLRYYFTVAAPTPDQLGFLGDLSAALVVPLWQNLNLTLGTNALLFRGQAAPTDGWGLSFNPTIGLSYGGVWKPQWGISY